MQKRMSYKKQSSERPGQAARLINICLADNHKDEWKFGTTPLGYRREFRQLQLVSCKVSCNFFRTEALM